MSARRKRNWKLGWVFMGVVLLIQIWVMTDRVDMPLLLLNEDISNKTMQAGLNHLELGFQKTKGLIWWGSGYPRYEAEPYPYLHGPPLMTWLLALTFWLFGGTTAVLRASCILVALASTVAFWRFLSLGKMPSPWRHVSLLLFAFAPMTLFYGRIPSCLMIGALFGILAASEFLKEKPRPWALGLSGFFLALSSFYSVLPVGIMGAMALFREKWRPFLRPTIFLGAGVGTGLLALAVMGISAVGWEAFYADYADAFLRRTSSEAEGGERFTLVAWFFRALKWTVREMTPIVVLGGIAGASFPLWRRFIPMFKRKKFKFNRLAAVTLVFLLAGFGYIFLLKSGSWVHRTFYVFLMAPLAAFTGIFLSEIFSSKFSLRQIQWAAGLTVLVFYFFSQPTVQIRYERDGMYPTSHSWIKPPLIWRMTSKFWGSKRPSEPIRWDFPKTVDRKTRWTCIHWPNLLNECKGFRKPAKSGIEPLTP